MEGGTLTGHVFLVGFMGAGKSTVARRIARTCGVTALDMDKYIERAQGKTIPEIFAEGGEKTFRRIETATLKELAHSEDAMIISCGGGVVLRPENRDIMREGGYVIHLQVDADEAASRISDTSSRPLFKDLDSARQLCESRMPLYEQAANHTVQTAGKSVGRITGETMRHLRTVGILI